MQKKGNSHDLERRRAHVARMQDCKEWKQSRTLPPANAAWPTCLIIAPSSVVGNWEREFETWGFFELGMYVGPPSARGDVLTDFKLGRLDVLVTSFEVARIDIDLIDELPWSCIIIDEVHRVKNPRSKLFTAFSRFTCPRRFGLSGTVIQNGYEELWTVLDWTNPGAVGSKKQWETYVEKPLRSGQSKSALDEEHVQAALVAKLLTEKLLPHLFLRRTKQIIQDQLPNKTDQVVFCPLTPMQIKIYRRILDLDAVANLVHKDESCECGSRKARKKCCHPVHPGDLFKYMSTLIKISNHLALILPSPTDTTEQTARNRELSRLAFPTGPLPKYGPSMLRPEFCGKWMVLETLLKEWRREGSNKVLIFTKSVKLLDMLEFHLNSRGHGFVKLDGSTKQSDRMPMIDRFQEDPDIFIFLISTMAGGTGLNLTAANKVVIFDPNWNPAHDLQAMDRAYRFGQTRDVAVYRLLAAGSIEELIYARQVYKQQQMQVGYNASLQTRYFEGVQGDKRKQGELFGIKNIFKLHEHTLATKMAIESAHVSDLDWAFAYMGGSGSGAKRPRGKQAGVQWVYEEEAKTGRDYDDLRGLGALLFDDAPPDLKPKPNDIEKTLSAIGVHYTHRNDDLIAESAIEGQRMQAMMQERKKKAKQVKQRRDSAKGKGKEDKPPEPEWPPRRRHHKAPPSPGSKLKIRQRALIEQGLLKSPEDLPKFAQDFAQKTLVEQNAFLAQLDDYAKKNFK
ncbi:P-loop containing nucleoside triphosphate hydrolase protein [Trametes maxima]|nr:P-loop containing nucleoside triphosphate hydrolase protein [Trametes maxima]